MVPEKCPTNELVPPQNHFLFYSIRYTLKAIGNGAAEAVAVVFLKGWMSLCSISGIVDFINSKNIDKEAAIEMSRRMKHRGPDQSGEFYNDFVAFTHNRLAVIDVRDGLQPMQYIFKGNRYCIVYNGELYNAPELTAELKSLGHTFATHCDTEVLIAAYAQWGEDCLHKLNGIFAFAICDEQTRTVFCARDRLGVKPFFYTLNKTAFIFASEIKAVLAHPNVQAEITQQGIWQLLYLSPTRLPDSGLFKDILELLPGECAVFSQEGLKKTVYWRLQAREHTDDFDQTVAKTRELLLDSITRQLVSDVPLCTFLSGGLDSSIISACAASHYKQIGGMLSTYSFEHEGNDRFFKPTMFQPESDEEYAAYTAAELGTVHTVLTASAKESADLLLNAVKYRDLPGMADIDSSLLLYCQKVKRSHTVALSGECADELFGGYPWFHRQSMLKSNTFPWIHSLEIRSDVFNADFAQPEQGEEYIRDLYASWRAACPSLVGESEEEKLKRLSGFLSITFFMKSLLERKDRMSMASGLEVRVPFADHRLMDYVFNVPWSMKYQMSTEKYLLRKAVDGLLPNRVLYRKKSPYPKTHNPAYEELIKGMLLERMSDPHSLLKSMISQSAVDKIFRGENITWFGQLMGRAQLAAYILQLDFWFEYNNVRIV